MNATSAKCGHIKRRLRQGLPLTGKVLEFALEIVGEGDEFSNEIARKLKAGAKLGDYESHILMDVWLLHIRLAAQTRARIEREQEVGLEGRGPVEI